MKYIKGLDVLRALAVLLILHHHWGPFGFASPVLDFISRKIIPVGGFAVDLFFVLSGFLLTGILLRSKASLRWSKWEIIKNFIARRTLRIFPIYYLFIFLLYVVNYDLVRQHIFYLATYTTNFQIYFYGGWVDKLGHLWTLAVEEQYYLIWPLVIVFTPDKYLTKMILLFIAGGVLFTGYFEHQRGFFATILPFSCFQAFAIGALYAHSLTNVKLAGLVRNTLLCLLPLSAIAYILVEIGYPFIPFRLVCSVIAVNAIIFVQECKYGRTAQLIFNCKPLINLGKISYGVYLYHPVIPTFYYGLLHFSEKKLHAGKTLLSYLYEPYFAEFLEIVMVIFIAYLSYVTIERPLLKFKRYFGSNDRDVIELA